MANRTADAFLNYFELAIGLVVLAFDRLARHRVFHLLDFLSVGAGRDAAPRGSCSVVQDRAIRIGCEALQKREVSLDMAGSLSDLNETLVAIAKHSREIQNILVAHQVSDHRRSVEVRLGGIRTQPLDGKAA